MNQYSNPEANTKIFRELKKFAKFGRQDSRGVTRLAYTENMRKAENYFEELCLKEKLLLRRDEVGNLIARRPGEKDDLPAVVCGSHLDTVINGGLYDGVLGVLSGLEVIRRLNANNIATEHPIELIAFACEESSRFGVSTIGSKAMSGKINSEILLSLKDKQGITFKSAIEKQGLKFEKLKFAKRNKGDIKAFIELHIEQGPVLESTGESIGIATTIAAPTRYLIEVSGKASHSGTTTMNLRRDALSAASEIILYIEDIAQKESKNSLVGTVGTIQAYPGATNTIPGLVKMIAEFRGADLESKKRAQDKLLRMLKEVEEKRGVKISFKLLSDELPVKLSKDIAKIIEDACLHYHYKHKYMVSGAGHDAMNLIDLCPVGLIFVPSVNGVSHHPDEFTYEEDILKGINILYYCILKLAIEKVYTK